MPQHYDIHWLTQKIEQGESLKFLYFWGHTAPQDSSVGKHCLSQWYESRFIVAGIEYPTAEHWMMAQKALLFNDQLRFEKIIQARTAGEAKDLGRQVLGFEDQLWQEKRFDIVKQGNWHKFNQNPSLEAFLLQTGHRVLVEASPVDRIWGIGLAESDPIIARVEAWKGLNLLGFALMELRDMLRSAGG